LDVFGAEGLSLASFSSTRERNVDIFAVAHCRHSCRSEALRLSGCFGRPRWRQTISSNRPSLPVLGPDRSFAVFFPAPRIRGGVFGHPRRSHSCRRPGRCCCYCCCWCCSTGSRRDVPGPPRGLRPGSCCCGAAERRPSPRSLNLVASDMKFRSHSKRRWSRTTSSFHRPNVGDYDCCRCCRCCPGAEGFHPKEPLRTGFAFLGECRRRCCC